MRAAMFPPILPSPTIPIFTARPRRASADGLASSRGTSACFPLLAPSAPGRSGPGRASRRTLKELIKTDPPRAALALPQGQQVAVGLGVLQCREAIVLAGDRHVIGIIPHHLHEHARVGPALVELAGGVQEPG